MNITIGQILCWPFGGMFNLGLLIGVILGFLFCAYWVQREYERVMRRWFLWSILLLFTSGAVSAKPVLLDKVEMINPDGTITAELRSGGWWQDDAGNVQDTDSSLTVSNGVWDIENISAPHKVYAATDEVRWRVDPPAGESAGFEIAFSTVSLYLFDEVNGDVEKTINWARAALDGTEVTTSTVSYPLFASCSLYVISTPEGYKTNFYVADPSLVPDPQGVEYFGPSADLSKVYFAVRYSVSKWPDLPMTVDGEEYGPGSIVDGYSAQFGDDLWFLPTKAYRNVQNFNGESWTWHEDESYVYYVFDRLAQEILVLAPYTLFVGAENALIDPAVAWTSAQATSDDGAYLSYANPTTNYGSSDLLQSADYTGQITSSTFRWNSLPSIASISWASAWCKFTYKAQGDTNALGIAVRRIGGSRDFVETEVTWNIYKTSNNWTTAGAGGSGTDYDATIPTTGGNAADLVIYNNSQFNNWVEEWIEGSHANNGIILDATDGGTIQYKQYWSDDAASSANRPLLTITYIQNGYTLPVLPASTNMVYEAGSILTGMVIDATTEYIAVADIANDVTAELILDDGTAITIGNGAGADDNWDIEAASDLIGGGSMFAIASNYALTKAAAGALYFLSSLTGLEETRTFGLSPLGSASLSGDIEEVLAAVQSNSARIQIVTQTQATDRTAFGGWIASVSTEVTNQSSTIQSGVTSARNTIGGWIASVSTNVDNTRNAAGGWIASVSTLVQNASTSIEADLSAVAADVDIILATTELLNNYVKVSRAYYNTDSALTNGEFDRDIPANALSHVENRWLSIPNVIAENWGTYVKREFVIYSYPDSAAGTILASHLIPSSTAPTERTWTDKGASLW